MAVTEKRILLGFAIAFRFVDRGFDEAGKMIYEHGAILLGPRLIQAADLPEDLAASIETFLQEHIEKIDE